MQQDARIDAYIAAKPAFAQPILEHLRAIVRRTVPGAQETIKWSRPFFTVDGRILCNMSAFRQHCSFGIWNSDVSADIRGGGVDQESAMGSFGKLTSLADLPPDAELVRHLKKAAAALAEGYVPLAAMRARASGVKARGADVEVPAVLAAALAKHSAAARTFAALSPSHKRDYTEWVAGAKRETTRTDRVAKAIAWLSEGKRLHWKYEPQKA